MQGCAVRRKRNLKLVFDTVVLRVKVFPSLSDLQDALVKDGEERNEHVLAATNAPYKGRKHITVWFAEDALSLTIIAHEAVHVAYAIGRWGVNPWQDSFEADEEERLAYPVGEIVNALYISLVEAGWRPVAQQRHA